MFTIDPDRAGSIRRTATAPAVHDPELQHSQPLLDVFRRHLVRAADDVDAALFTQ
jgi:hypothetical protein